jgi:lipoprotein-releasing system permease protein
VLLSDNLQSIIDVLQKLIGVQFLDASVYLMDELPAYVEWGDLLKVCAVAFILCALATVYPAWRASRTQPAEALRHE